MTRRVKFVDPMVARFWIPVSGIVPVLALAYLVEIRQQARRMIPEDRITRRVMSLFWVTLGLSLVFVEFTALYALKDNRSYSVLVNVAIIVLSFGIGAAISDPIWRLFAALNADAPASLSGVLRQLRKRASGAAFGRWLFGVTRRKSRRVAELEHALAESNRLSEHVRKIASRQAETMEEIQFFRDTIARLAPNEIDARKIRFYLASSDVAEIAALRRETFDVLFDTEELRTRILRRLKDPNTWNEDVPDTTDSGIELVRKRLADLG